MDLFYGVNFFIFIFAIFLTVAAFYGLLAVIGYSRLAKQAADDWDYKVSQKMNDRRITKDGYIRAYRRAHAPRRAAYIATTLALVTLSTPAVLTVLSAILYWLWKMDQIDGEQTRVVVRGVDLGGLTYEPGNLVFGFIAFFGILGLWTMITKVALLRYYRHLPGTLRDEILKEWL